MGFFVDSERQFCLASLGAETATHGSSAAINDLNEDSVCLPCPATTNSGPSDQRRMLAEPSLRLEVQIPGRDDHADLQSG